MQIGICSFSFHRLLADGKQDIFQYIQDCKALGCTQLDPWNAHLADLKSSDDASHVGRKPGQFQHLTAADEDYIARVRQAADKAGLPFGCIAVDGAHIYEPAKEARQANRERAYKWLDIAHQLGASQVRIDAGGPEDMPDAVFAIIREGYRDLIDRAAPLGVEIVVENHWGPTVVPANVIKLLEGIDGLGLLLDMHNWKRELRDAGRQLCAPYATATHLKTFEFDADGNEISDEDVPAAIRILLDANYKGCWSIESVPRDGNEIEGAAKTIALLKHCVEG